MRLNNAIDTSYWLYTAMQMMAVVLFCSVPLLFALIFDLIFLAFGIFGNGIQLKIDLPDAHRSTYIDVLMRVLLLLASWRNEMSYGCLSKIFVVVQISQPTQMQFIRYVFGWYVNVMWQRYRADVMNGQHTRDHEPRTTNDLFFI